MLKHNQRKEIVLFAEKQVVGNDSLHGMTHLQETASTALMLAKSENADCEICWTAAMLHDICKGKAGDHAAEGSRLAGEFLDGLGLPEEFVKKVMDAIYFHNKDFSHAPVERMILWDADKLPLMVQEGFKKRMVPYWIMKNGEKKGIAKAVEEYYFYRSRFHTKTGKNIAEKQSEKMAKYIKELTSRYLIRANMSKNADVDPSS